MAYPVRSYSHESAGTASSSAGAAAAAPPVDDAHLGAWRSRTLLFLSYRSSAPRPSTSAFASSSRSSFESPLLGGDLESQSAPQRARRPGTYYDASGALASYPPAAAEALPPRWVDTSDAVEALLQGIGPKMERLERMHAKHLLPGFVDRRAEERAIETLTQEITKDLRKATSQIRQLANATAANAAASEAALARNVQTALATRVQTLSAAFRKRQADYMRRMRGIEERGKGWTASSGSSKVAEEREALREDVELSRAQLSKSSSQSQLLLQEEEAPQTQAELDLAARDREIDQIARSIAELAELFQDLSALVIDQGTMLDRIDYNIDSMSRDMQESVRELNTATTYQARTSRGQCILLLVLLLMLALALLIIKPFWRAFSSPAPLPPQVSSSPFRP